ncbi:MAG TPA: hypothetical protein VFP84_35640 [Kofleriaceae bacterium]|nr:hypothetical protein [Kofleriaceae bacterium]
MRRQLGFGIALALAVSAAPALADSHAEAVVLFDQGIKDLKAGRIDKACNELQASLDMVKDSGTKGALARCHGLAGRVAKAWLLWRELADTAPKPALRADAAAQAAKLEPRLPHYTIKLGAAMPNLVVQINGLDVAPDLAVAVPIDPGTVSVTAVRRDGDRDVSEPWSHDYQIAEGQTLAIEIPRIDVIKPAAAPPPTTTSAPADVAIDVHPDADDIMRRRHRRHVVSWVFGGLGAVAAGVGTYFAIDASSKYSDAKDLCGGAIKPCQASGIDASRAKVNDARTSANIATGALIGAGALVVTAIIVSATAPSAVERRPVAIAPTASARSLGVALTGSF